MLRHVLGTPGSRRQQGCLPVWNLLVFYRRQSSVHFLVLRLGDGGDSRGRGKSEEGTQALVYLPVPSRSGFPLGVRIMDGVDMAVLPEGRRRQERL